MHVFSSLVEPVALVVTGLPLVHVHVIAVQSDPEYPKLHWPHVIGVLGFVNAVHTSLPFVHCPLQSVLGLIALHTVLAMLVQAVSAIGVAPLQVPQALHVVAVLSAVNWPMTGVPVL
jgi:hypothetical protein